MIVKRMAKADDAATGRKRAVGNKSGGKTLAMLAAIPAYLQRE